MIRSMTGYGKADTQFQEKKISVEIRSLNSKQLDLNIKVPGLYREKETELRNELTAGTQRGKVELAIYFNSLKKETNNAINEVAFLTYYEQLKKLSTETLVPVDSPEIYQAILRLPEVLDVEKKELTDEEWGLVMQAVKTALTEFNNFRQQEGAALAKDLLHRIDLIENLLKEIEPFEKERLNTIKSRIENNLNEVFPSLDYDRNRFEQELIYYIEKIDITEEKVRLKQHCEYFKDIMKSEEAPGRKLGFISQEIGREINTLGSKANQADIQKRVVCMKDELEKIKEQVLNIL